MLRFLGLFICVLVLNSFINLGNFEVIATCGYAVRNSYEITLTVCVLCVNCCTERS